MRTHRRRGATLVGALVGAVVVLAGCAGIPTDGPVTEANVELPDTGGVIPIAADDPTPDAPPSQIVSEFLRAASAGLYDDFTVARKFLTVTASDSWDPRAQVIVYTGEPPVVLRDDDTVVVTLDVAAVVDAAGRFTEAVPDAAPQERVLRLTRDAAGQWRVAELDDGVLMSQANFQTQFREGEIYFASPDLTELVPEARWFPSGRFESAAVAALLDGPSPWLADAVRTGVPPGASLQGEAVTVEDGVATVELGRDLQAAEADRGLFQAQLEATLGRRVGRVTDVEVTVGGIPWSVSGVPSFRQDTSPETGPYVLSDGALAVVDRREVVPLDDVASLEDVDARSPALSPDLVTRVVLDGDDRLLHLPLDASAPVPLVTGEELLAPTVDRFRWVWTGESRSDGSLTVVRPTDEPRTVAADWLAGTTVHSVRVSRDGARVAVVYSVPGEPDVVVEVAGVVRDDDGVPQALSAERLAVGAVLDDAAEVSWVDETTLAVLGRGATSSTPVVHRVPLGGWTEPMPQIDGAVGIAAGRADRVYVLRSTGQLYLHQGLSWVAIAKDVADPVFPG